MRTYKTVLSALISGLFLASVSMAAMQSPGQSASPTPSSPAKMERFSGIIIKLDETNKNAEVQFHKDKMNFAFSDQTKIMKGKKDISFSGLKKGMWASIGYMKEGDLRKAESVRVNMPITASKEKSVVPKGTTSTPANPS